MSDEERPANGGGKPGNGSGAHGLPARNMADIARLFLEGARPLPARVPPVRRAPQSAARPAEAPVAKSHDERPGEAATAVLGLACGAREGDSWRLLIQAGQGLAQEQATTVALVGLLPNGSKTSFVVDVVGVESMEELPVVRTAQEAGLGEGAAASDLQMARALHRLRPAVGLWILSAPACEGRTFPALASIVREWLLACPTDNDGLIAGYQYLKKAWTCAGAGKDLRLSPTVYLLSEDYAQAAVVHKRLRKAAQEFLGTDLALAGAGPIRRAGGVVAQEPIRVLSVTCEGPEDALWAAVLDELCPMTGEEMAAPPPPMEVERALDHVEDQAAAVARTSVTASAMMLDGLAQVLEPEERAALAASLEEPGVAVAGRPGGATEFQHEDTKDTKATKNYEGEEGEHGAKIDTEGTESQRGTESRPSSASEFRHEDAKDTARPPAATEFQHEDTKIAKARKDFEKEGKGGLGDGGIGMRAAGIQGGVPLAEVSAASAPDGVAPTVEAVGREPVKAAKVEQVVGAALRAFEVEGRLDRAGQWEVVEGSILDLMPRSAVLDARAPMGWASETCLVVDAAGRVNAWMLYKDGAGWFALREWANEHRKLLALTRRDLRVDTEAEVAVHLVMPLEEEEAAARRGEEAVGVLVRAVGRTLHVYRMRRVQWGGRPGVMVVPAG